MLFQALIWLGLYGVAVKDPFDNLRWEPVHYPPGSILHWLGLALLLLGLAQLLTWRFWTRRGMSPGRATAGVALVIVVNLVLVDRGCLALSKRLINFRPHPLLHHVTLPDSPAIPSNSMGLRYEEVPSRREPGEVRLLVIGDSSAYGVWVPYADRFSSVLETELRKKYPGRLIRVINGACPGYTSLFGARSYRLFLHQLDPDLFIISYNNDTTRGPVSDSQAFPWTATARLKCALYSSQLYLALRKVLVNSLSRPQAPLPDEILRVSPEEVQASYSELLSHQKKPSLVMEMPLPVDAETPELKAYHEQIEALTPKLGAVLVNCFDHFQANGWRDKTWFHDECHPTSKGHRVLAEMLLKAIDDGKLLVP